MAWSSPRTWTTGEVVTAAHMNQEVRDNLLAVVPNQMAGASWSPTWEATTTNPPSGVIAARQYRVGALQFVWVAFGHSIGGGTGTFFVELPVAASGISASASSGQGTAIGTWQARDASSTGNNESGTVALRSSNTVHFQRSAGGVLTASNPFTWAVDDVLTFHAVYPVA